jgi:hypothetical protein
MTEENVVFNFDEALNALNKASDSFKVDLWVPSKQKTITFKEIDAKQQKSLLSVAINDNIYSSDFNKTFYDILKSNILNEDASIIDELNVADRSFIAIGLRNQISEELNVKFTDEISEKVNLKSVISKFNTYILPNNENLELKNENVSLIVNLALPNLKNELNYDLEFYKDYKKTDAEKDVNKLITDAFIGETSKYINSVKLNDNIFEFDTLSFNQKLRIVEKLPSGLIQKILEKISAWKKDIDSLLTVTSGENSKVISIDSLLFLS